MYTLEKFHQLVQSHMDKCFHCNSFKILMVITEFHPLAQSHMDKGFHYNSLKILMVITEISINRKMDKILYTHAMEYHLVVQMKQLDLHVST